mgnify:FL=1|jgi:hypothetical protein
MRIKQRTAILATLPLALGLSSCAVEKTLTIMSEPPGAEVRLGDTSLGQTPVTVDFLHYGTQRLGVYLEGYDRIERDLRIRAPWYGRFPMDFVSEVLLPIGWEDHRVVFLDLEASPVRLDLDEFEFVRMRAEFFRTATDSPPVDLPPRPADKTSLIDATPISSSW